MQSPSFYFKNPNAILLGLLIRLNWMFPDKLYLKILFRLKMGYKLDLKNPKTFSEKLQWLKLYNRKPEYTTMVDKYAVKDYVANIIGDEYIIPTLGIWDTPNDIDWDSLPDKFVLKTTHGGGGGGVVICKDKSTFDKQKAINTLWRSYKSDIYKSLREWPYKNVPKRIIAEKFMEISSSKKQDTDLPDYKFYCFDGEPTYCQVIRDRRTEETIDFYDMKWNHMPFVGSNPVVQNGLNPVEKPICLENMIKVCKELAKNIPFSRIDLYVIDDTEYFGEITFYPTSGLVEFTPQEWNGKLGDLINLQGVFRGGYNCLIDNNIIKINKVNTDLSDYKFYCFNGEPKFFYITTDRLEKSGLSEDFFDINGNFLPIQQKGEKNNIIRPKLPKHLDKMVELASILSIGIPLVRIDFYEIVDEIKFGEITFFCGSGFSPFEPEEWETLIGSWIKLP